jgi:hypothetical protein
MLKAYKYLGDGHKKSGHLYVLDDKDKDVSFEISTRGITKHSSSYKSILIFIEEGHLVEIPIDSPELDSIKVNLL